MIRRGMTLVELLLAVALSAMLLAALVGLLRGTSNQTKLAKQFDQPVWQTRLPDLIRADLKAADSIWSVDQTVVMRSSPPQYHGDRTGLRTIAYECVELESGFCCLLRSDQDSSDVLAVGPTKITIERVDRDGFPQPLPSNPGPVNRQFRAWVFQNGQTLIDRTITL
ncbi:MAG: prepilin-type N-terminal cleavage/methylation domain-containing protein [Planctomycetota bacterium]